MSARVCELCFGSGVLDSDPETACTCAACQGTGIIGRAYLDDEGVA